MKIIKKGLILLSCIFFIASITYAATDNFVVSEDTTVSDVTLGSTSTTMIIFASSTSESMSISGGTFTVTNPAIFYVGSSDSNVNTLVVLESGSLATCTVNSVPGTSYVTIPIASSTYTIQPSTAADCNSLCTTITGAATYNSYPTCGAASCNSGYTRVGSGSSAGCCTTLSNTATYNSYPTCGAASCNSGYVLSGSGSSATCVSGGGGGGASGGSTSTYIPPTTIVNGTTETQSFQTTTDGTEVTSNTTNTYESGVVVETKVKSIIQPVENPTVTQIVKLDSSKTADVKEVAISIPNTEIKNITNTFGSDKNIQVELVSKTASLKQQTSEARGGKFFVGFDVFSLDINVNNNSIKNFSTPLILTFDVTSFKNTDILKVHYFNELTEKWQLVGNGGIIVNGLLTVEIDHFTDFALMRETAVTKEEEILDERELQLQQINIDSKIVFLSGTDQNQILTHNNKDKDVSALDNGMIRYTDKIVEGVPDLTVNEKYAINNFIVYGTKSTQILGAGERAGVVNSYKKAFKKLPKTESDWRDCIAIGNGRWPSETSEEALDTAKKEFQKIYLRKSNMDNPHDNAAVTMIAYGLRPSDRNLDSEKAGIKIFKGIYKYSPSSALDWDIVRAISYSGAIR